MYDGQGTYTYADGSKYVGQFKRGERQHGTHTQANGDSYSGQWRDGAYHFQVYAVTGRQYGDGSKYVGQVW